MNGELTNYKVEWAIEKETNKKFKVIAYSMVVNTSDVRYPTKKMSITLLDLFKKHEVEWIFSLGNNVVFYDLYNGDMEKVGEL